MSDLEEINEGIPPVLLKIILAVVRHYENEIDDLEDGMMWAESIQKNREIFLAVMERLSKISKGGLLLNPEKNVPRSWEYFKKIVVPAQAGVWKELDRAGRVMHVMDSRPTNLDEVDLYENYHSSERAKIRAHHRDTRGTEAGLIQEEKAIMSRRGFPYEAKFPEYIRFLQNNFAEVTLDGVLITFEQVLRLLIPSPIKADEFKKGHTYIVGRTGSGKSELLKKIVEQLGGFCVVIDPHGDLANDICKIRNKYAYRVAPHERRFVVNPFDIEDKSQANRELVAQEITDLIEELVEDSGLSRLMTTVIFPIVYTLLKLPYADFKMLTDCINPSTGKAFLGGLRGLVEPHHKDIWRALEDDTYDTSKQSIFNRLQSLLNYRLIGQTLCGRDDFAEAVARAESGATLVVSLPIPEIGEAVAVALGKFFMTRMQIWAKHRKSDRIPVCLIVDEFHNFLSHATALTLDQFGRKFKLFMILAHQHIQQITDREIRGSVLGSTINKIGGMSNSDTRQALAKEMQTDPERFENLRPGHFVGRLGNGEAFDFYSRIVKLDRSQKIIYIESDNTDEFIDGWEGMDREQNTYSPNKNDTNVPRKTPEKPKPKFDI